MDKASGSSLSMVATNHWHTSSRAASSVFPESHFEIHEGLQLEDFSSKAAAHSFVLSLRPICETIFNFFLVAYVAALKVYRDHAVAHPAQRGWFVSTAPWEETLKFAEEALEQSLDAEIHRQENAIIAADVTATTALKALKLRYVLFQ
jgi:hypothetical protein